MKKRGRAAATKKTSAADFLVSPPQQGGATNASPTKSFEFNLNSPAKTATAGGSRRKSAPMKMNSSSPHHRSEAPALSSISELKELTSSRLDSIKRQIERSHSDIRKEFDSSNSRLHKRFKIQTQACQQLMDGVEKEFKKMSERITESCEAMKGSYAEFMVEAQNSGSRVCKTTIPEKVQSFEKAFDALRSRYGILSTP